MEQIKLKCSYCCETFDREKLYIIDINHRLPPEQATGTIYLCPHCYQLLKKYMTTENPNYIIPSGKAIIEQKDIDDIKDYVEDALDILEDQDNFNFNGTSYYAYDKYEIRDIIEGIKAIRDIIRDIEERNGTNN